MVDSGSQPSKDFTRWSRLTEKQRDCLDLLLERQTSKQIARQLGISKQAVDLRVTTARNILGAADRSEAAIIYARLKRTYDRMPYDPIIVPLRPELVPSHFSSDGLSESIALHDNASQVEKSRVNSLPFRDLLRHDHGLGRRAGIMAAMLVALALLILVGLAIAQALTRLISG